MKHNGPYPPVEQIKARAQAIGLTLTALAAEAGVARSTIFQLERGRDPHLKTINRIVTALEARELAQRDHLIALHGVPNSSEAAE
jgi:predicted transcriptional regulator